MLTRRAVLVGGLAGSVCAGLPVQASSWVDMGFRRVSLSREVDRIVVVNSQRVFRKLRLAVAGSEIFLHTATVHFINGVTMRYRFDALIADGGRSGVIDLPGEGRRIVHVDLAYRRVPCNGMAVVTLQGLPL